MHDVGPIGPFSAGTGGKEQASGLGRTDCVIGENFRLLTRGHLEFFGNNRVHMFIAAPVPKVPKQRCWIIGLCLRSKHRGEEAQQWGSRSCHTNRPMVRIFNRQ